MFMIFIFFATSAIDHFKGIIWNVCTKYLKKKKLKEVIGSITFAVAEPMKLHYYCSRSPVEYPLIIQCHMAK